MLGKTRLSESQHNRFITTGGQLRHKHQMLQYDNLTLRSHGAAPTCCRRDRGGERPSPGYCPAWCCDRGSGPSAAPLLAAAASAAAEEAASQRVAGTLQQMKAEKFKPCVQVLSSCNMRVIYTRSLYGYVSSLCNLSSSRQREAVPLPSHSAFALRSSAWLHIRYLQEDTSTELKQYNTHEVLTKAISLKIQAKTVNNSEQYIGN